MGVLFVCIFYGGGDGGDGGKSGKVEYVTDRNRFLIQENDALYLPKYSTYSHLLLTRNVECLQVSFDLEISTAGKSSFPIICSEPMPIYNCPEPIFACFTNLIAGFNGKNGIALSEFYSLVELFDEAINGKAKTYGKITPAVNYIHNHFTEKIYINELADMCGISQSHLRRLFNEQLMMSPIRYKNKILMDNACTMLQSGVMNVGEVSDSLGFNDVYTFSQAFKSVIGVSPNKYRKQ